MNAIKIIHTAERDVDHNRITIEEYEDIINAFKDVEAVVRCGFCRNAECPIPDKAKKPDWFCADGVK